MQIRRSWAIGIGLFAVLASGVAVQANTLVSTIPAPNSTVETAPTQVTVTADSDLADLGSSVTVTGPDGARVDDGSLQISGRTALVGIKPLTQMGTYAVAYQLVLANGSSLKGAYTFDFNGPVGATTPTPVTTLPPADRSSFLDRMKGGGVGLLLVGLILLVVATRVAKRRGSN